MTNYANTCKPFSPLDYSLMDKGLHKPFRLSQLVHRIKDMRQRSLQREQLKSLEPRLLNDIGLTAKEAEFEASKPFWIE